MENSIISVEGLLSDVVKKLIFKTHEEEDMYGK